MNDVNVINIQRFSLNDGPGIRTTVFFKSCPLYCPWCSNPESQKEENEILHFENKCKKCKICIAVCPNKCIRLDEKESIVIKRSECTFCGKCKDICLSDAVDFAMKKMSAKEIVDIALRDEHYYMESGGGLTISGGEPFMQSEALKEVLALAKRNNLHTAVESCGSVDENVFKNSIDDIDLLIVDIKSANNKKLLEVTGGDLELIVKNLQVAKEKGLEILIRVPIIPSFNESESDMKEIFDLVEKIGLKKVDLIPYHVMGRKKYSQLGLSYPYEKFDKNMEKACLKKIAKREMRKGIEITISGK